MKANKIVTQSHGKVTELKVLTHVHVSILVTLHNLGVGWSFWSMEDKISINDGHECHAPHVYIC